jgi:hypothetical protein
MSEKRALAQVNAHQLSTTITPLWIFLDESPLDKTSVATRRRFQNLDRAMSARLSYEAQEVLKPVPKSESSRRKSSATATGKAAIVIGQASCEIGQPGHAQVDFGEAIARHRRDDTQDPL